MVELTAGWLDALLEARLADVVLLPGGGSWKLVLMLLPGGINWKLMLILSNVQNVQNVNIQMSKMFTMSYLYFCEFLCNFVQFGSVFPVFTLESKSKS